MRRNTNMMIALFIAGLITWTIPATVHSAEKADFNALKNHSKNITAWIKKVGDKKNPVAPAEILTSAYAPSSAGVTPYESISTSIEFYDAFAAQEATSNVPDDKAIAEKVRAVSERLKRIKRGLEVAKKADSSTVGKSLETSHGYRELLNLRAKGPELEMNFDEIGIAAAKRAHLNSTQSKGTARKDPAAGAR